MKLGLIIKSPSGKSPFIRTGGKTGRVLKREAETLLRSVPGEGVRGRLDSRPTLIASTQQASACVTAAAVAAADTVTINGTALTATQFRADAVVTCASVADADTVTVNGVVFTAKTTVTDATIQFDRSLGTDTLVAADLVRAINASANILIDGLISAKATAGAVTVYADTAGTAGNSYTLASSNGTRLAITGDTAGALNGGAAIVNNQFDYIGTNTETASALVAAISASSTSLISGHVAATNKQAIVTLASVATGDTVTIADVVLRARNGTHSVTTGLAPGEFSVDGTDTQDAVSFCVAVNEHPTLSQLVFANNASGVVTIYERAPSLGQTIPISTSNGTRLAITSGLTALTAGAIVYIESILPGIAGNATTLATSNGTRLAITIDSSGRLARGTSSTYTY